MTTARNSWRSSAVAIAAAGVVASTSVSAHRLDEYLQAARITVDPGRVRVTIDLTPGVAVATAVLADMDRDGNGTLGAGETQAYTARVLRGLSLDIDEHPLAMTLADSQFPTIEQMRSGDGTIRLELSAALPTLDAGAHLLHFKNANRPDISAYLANAMMPDSRAVAIVEQQRDFTQSELSIHYALSRAYDVRAIRWVVGVIGGLVVCAAVFWRRRALL